MSVIKYYVPVRLDPGGRISVINLLTNTEITSLPISESPHSVVCNPDTKRIYVQAASPTSNINEIAVIDGNTDNFLIIIPLPTNGMTGVDRAVFPALTPDRRQLWVPLKDLGLIQIIDTATNTLAGTISGFTNPVGVKFNERLRTAYITDAGTGNVIVLSLDTFSVIKTINVGTSANGIDITPDCSKLYVTSTADDTVSVISTLTNSVIKTIPTGDQPTGVNVSIDGRLVYVTNIGEIRIIDSLTDTLSKVLAVLGPGLTPGFTNFNPNPPFNQAFTLDRVNNRIIITDTVTQTVIGSIPITNGPGGFLGFIACILQEFDPSPGESINLRDPYQLGEITESVCIIVDKVYSHCQQRRCFPNITVELPQSGGPFTFVDVKFQPGEIVDGTLVVTPIPTRPNFSRVRFTFRVPFVVRVLNAAGQLIEIPSAIEDLQKDIVMFIPKARDEFTFSIVIETRSERLTDPVFVNNSIQFAVGIFIVIKVVGKVQLLIPAFGFCPEPPACEEFVPIVVDVCKVFEDFEQTPFPADFFPPQFENTECE